jgi:flavin-dependent dehydrogenase
VAVIGGGPAGAVTAHVIAAAGHRVVLIGRAHRRGPPLGEALVPSARTILAELGLLKAFTADGHRPSFGNESAWGSASVQRTDFIRSPYGHGWHLDRARFDAMLRESARAASTAVLEASRLRAFRDDGQGTWSLDVEAPGTMTRTRSRWLVDATGRSRFIARQLGVRRIGDDRLLAFSALFRPGRGGDVDSLSFVESVEDGWWYTALLLSGARTATFFTDADLEAAHAARTGPGFLRGLATTLHVQTRLAAFGYEMVEGPQATDARASRLHRLQGTRWLAVGDAALCFDPLSSQGLLTALYGGLKAGQALVRELAGDGGPLGEYEEAMLQVYRHYEANRLHVYRCERRWPHGLFWRRRHGGR